jgi:hypothetical protein
MLAMVGLPQSAAFDADAPPSKPNTRQVDASSFFISVPFIGDAYKETNLPLGSAPVFVFAKLNG